jgi:hypothetical protein
MIIYVSTFPVCRCEYQTPTMANIPTSKDSEEQETEDVHLRLDTMKGFPFGEQMFPIGKNCILWFSPYFFTSAAFDSAFAFPPISNFWIWKNGHALTSTFVGKGWDDFSTCKLMAKYTDNNVLTCCPVLSFPVYLQGVFSSTILFGLFYLLGRSVGGGCVKF